MGLETSLEAKFFAVLRDKAKLSILSFTTSPSFSTEYPYFLQIAQDETTQFKGIATLIESFKWKDAILIYEDTETLPYLVDSLQEKDIHIAYKRAVSPLATDDQILEKLHKIMTMETTVVIVHMSPSLVSHFFLHVKRLGLMREGYAWIITDKTMNFLNSMDSSIIDSMQGALGFKSYIPTSNEFHNFTLRWRRKFHMEVMELNVLGLWAYDAIWAIAMATEKVKMPQIRENSISLRLNLMDLANIRASKSGSILLNEILQTRFKGLSGEFQLMNGKKLISKAFEIVNVLGKGDIRVGFWTLMDGITKEVNPSVDKKYSSSHSGIEAIIWPGGSTTTPKGWVLPMSGKKLRIGVPLKQGFPEFINVDFHPQTNATIVTGFCIDVFNTAIDALEYENYDAVVGDITITSNRSLYVDFTFPYTDIEGITMAGVVAIIDEIPYIKLFLVKYPVGYAMITSEPTTNGFGFVFRKGSPLVPEISWAIAKLREEGKLMMMENEWFKSQSSFMSQDSVTSPNIPNSLDFDRFRGLFLISGISSALALLIFLICLFHKKWHAHDLGSLSRGALLFIMKYFSPKNSNMI
ncbi:hypothetical protein F0562_002205 [Nyssa sinensis]|uniref:Ionotropic glutamate receptor C-terminal domain-containing protein n=1 Tax=Nyssa sinensis TaxID=561372 RepID=A0A5J5CA85_9ASTE|nr:hypothetical protein F0562_002205 [Nyssa sinensis]